jgi:hypothetical protein
MTGVLLGRTDEGSNRPRLPVRVKCVVWTGGLPFLVLPREADCLAARRDFAFNSISAASQPFRLRALSYIKRLATGTGRVSANWRGWRRFQKSGSDT